eukprot:4869295-Pleurochrysis_carterae.AAC.4
MQRRTNELSGRQYRPSTACAQCHHNGGLAGNAGISSVLCTPLALLTSIAPLFALRISLSA